LKKQALDFKIKKHDETIKQKIERKEMERRLKLEHEAII